MRTRYIFIALALLVMAGLACQVSGCQPTPETPTPTPSRTPTATVPPVPDTPTPTATATTIVVTPVTATATTIVVTPTATTNVVTATATRPIATATPELLGQHRVVPGDTLWDIAGLWYAGPGCYEYCPHLKWPRIWEANVDVVETPQVIYPGEVLRIPEGE